MDEPRILQLRYPATCTSCGAKLAKGTTAHWNPDGKAATCLVCLEPDAADIDHVVVAPWGVFVIDAKNYEGRVERRDRGGWFSTDYRLYVGGRDKTALIAGLDKQVKAVRTALGEPFAEVRIYKTLCFVNADWSLFARPIELGGAHVLWPRALGKLIRSEGTLGRETIERIERTLALALPAA